MEESVHDGHRKRLKEQFLKNGLDAFQTHQILELLLFYAVPRRDTNPLAHRLLDTFGSLSAVLDAAYEDLCAVPGVSEHTATLLVFCGRLLNRYYKEKITGGLFLTKRQDMEEYMKAQFVNQQQERFLLLCMNNRGKVLACSVISEGTVNATEVNIRMVMQNALHCHATAVVVAHNHPGGFALPSADDLNVTKQLRQVLSAVEIQLLDHLIFAPDKYISLRNTPQFAPYFSCLVKDKPFHWKEGEE